MTDLLRVLPHFSAGQFAKLIPVLENHGVSTSDLLTLEAADIGKRTRLPLLDVKRLCSAVLDALHADLAGPEPGAPGRHAPEPDANARYTSVSALRNTASSLSQKWQTISTLDSELDHALGGGIPAGYVTEVTGESGAGKTQFLLSLLLSVQLPPPHGLGRPALYISTEAPLSTRRLAQMLSANPLFQRLAPAERPSLDNIISTVTQDLESQDHILTFQVPVEVERRGIGLIVLDSVAANYRAEFERSASSSGGKHGSNMGARTAELLKLGMHLRNIAQRHNLAVVVSNQVADSRPPPGAFNNTPLVEPPPSSVPLPSSSHPQPDEPPPPPPPPPPYNYPPPIDLDDPHHHLHPSHPSLLLDHQQRWFTGWGDDPASNLSLKTPALGLVWTTQIAGRIALFRRPVPPALRRRRLGHHQSMVKEETGRGVGMGIGSGIMWERLMKVVFAPHVAGTGPGLDGAVRFEVWMGGLRGLGAVNDDLGGVEDEGVNGDGNDDDDRGNE
ncbi:P-loop containing nucleoside triphosphate hydrolase protein [Corynascus similis CBS 632.67]